MIAQFFANYLLEENYLNKRQVIESLKGMKNSRVKLGVLAIDAGYLTAKQVEELHESQFQVDKRFGDLAVEAGYLTETQVEELLSDQPSRYLALCQSLVDKEYMDTITISEAMSKFKEIYNISETDMADSSGEKLIDVVKVFYKLGTDKQSGFIATYIKLLIDHTVRFIGDDFIPLHLEERFISSDAAKVDQRISGEFDVNTVLETDDISLLQMVSRYAGEDIPVFDEYAMAAAGDFLNLHNGLFLVNLSNFQQVELKLAPPLDHKGATAGTDVMCCIPLLFSFGTVNFVMEK